MWEAVVPLGSPVGVVKKRLLKTISTVNECIDGSRITVATPVPGDPVAGFSLAPLRSPVKVMGAA